MGQHFGPFVLKRPLGVGGTAEVFIAHKKGDPRQEIFVLKRIRPELADDDQYARRMEFEAQIGSMTAHQNLVKTFEFGRVGDCHYVTFEFVRGRSLKRLLDGVLTSGEPPEVAVGLTIARGVLGALGVLHGWMDEGHPRPVLHRDVTPNNVIITPEGKPVLIDFGIAKDILGPAITQIGNVIGTARYMSPEHKAGEFLDERADVFSASVLIYEVLAGRPPWPKLPGARELLRTLFDPPEMDRHIPDDVADVLLNGLACDRALRPRSAQDMLAALEATKSWSETFDSSDPWRATRTWAEASGEPLDDELDRPAISSAPASPSKGAESDAKWTPSGTLSSAPPPAVPPPSEVFDLKGLPPRKRALARTRDIRVPEEITGSRARLVAIGAGFVILALLLFLALR